MKKPLSIEIDLQHRLGYVYYAQLEGHCAGTLDVWADGLVAADLDDDGNVLGIEVLGLDDETLQHAHDFAAAHDLEFPAHLSELVSA